ncbi:MAG: DUF1552 domain-containing protein [Verrucomicrobiae bacterium]|jgi:hypothetical protein|nr:DUF1552 domain-containing protein [Verrucomicrobiae bacterium]
MEHSTVQTIDRRNFLRAAGIALALPPMASLSHRLKAATPAPNLKMVCVGNSFGMYPEAFFPKTEGTDFDLPHLLEPLAEHRRDLTVFSNLDHGIKGGHFAVHSFLSGVKTEEARSMPEGNITLDQRAAEHVASSARFPSLTVGSETGLHGGCRMSWTRSGARVPPITSPKELFHKLFVEDGAETRLRAKELTLLKGSILDGVHQEAKSLQKHLTGRDRDKLDEYFTSVRDVEKRIAQQENWQNVPKPGVAYGEPEYRGIVQDLPALFDLIALALQTNSTRVATLEVASQNFNTGILGVKGGYHSLSHHGKKKENIDALLKIERYQMEQFARFLQKLKEVSAEDESGSLFNNTMVLFGSGMGNGNAHTNSNLPIILAGAGFRHRGHVVCPTKRRLPLCNLYLSMLQRFGLETDSFGRSTGTLTGLETA